MIRKRVTRSVCINPTDLAQVQSKATECLPRETGGVLIGWRDPGTIRIEQFLQVNDPQSSRTSYVRNRDRAQEALDSILEGLPADTPLGYVGEWHSHPGNAGPSRQDAKELRSISRLVRNPVAMVVLALQSDGSWRIHAMTAEGRKAAPGTILGAPDDPPS